MRITPTLRKAINAAVRANVRGANPLAEVGERETVDGRSVNNCLLWAEDVDLGDIGRLALVKELADDPAHPGCYELDLYVTTGIGHDRELETNVGILIRDGVVVGASDSGRRLTEIKREIGFPRAPWDGDWFPAIDADAAPAEEGR